MAEYIEREALLKDISESVVFSVKEGQPSLEVRGANKITDRIKAAPIADVVEVVRCMNCKYFEIDEEDELGECKCGYMAVSYNGALYPRRTDFCSYGERKC